MEKTEKINDGKMNPRKLELRRENNYPQCKNF